MICLTHARCSSPRFWMGHRASAAFQHSTFVCSVSTVVSQPSQPGTDSKAEVSTSPNLPYRGWSRGLWELLRVPGSRLATSHASPRSLALGRPKVGPGTGSAQLTSTTRRRPHRSHCGQHVDGLCQEPFPRADFHPAAAPNSHRGALNSALYQQQNPPPS